MPKKLYTKALPSIDLDIQPFYEGLKRHEFLLFRCKKCGAWYWPVAFCRNHDNEPFYGNMEWTKASGKGKVFTFVIAYRAMHPAWQDDIPYVYAFVETDEGPLISSTVIGCEPKDVKIGIPVEVVYEDVTSEEYENIKEDFTLPHFRPVG